MYAIYESYLTKETVGAASANNTERGNINTTYRPASQGSSFGDLGEDNNETKIPREIQKLITSITNNAHKADYERLIFDCRDLTKLASQLALAKK